MQNQISTTSFGLRDVKNIYSFWGNHASLYALSDYVTFMGRPDQIRGTAAKRLGEVCGGRVLEVACGTGRNLPYLIRAVGDNGSVVGFDYSHEMLSAASQLCQENDWRQVTFQQGDAAELGVGGGNFDGILSVLGISAVPGWQQALRRCHELLRPGGRLSICDARLFQGQLAVLNPLLRKTYEPWAAWDPSKDIPGKIKEIFGNVEIEDFNIGTIYIASAVKE